MQYVSSDSSTNQPEIVWIDRLMGLFLCTILTKSNQPKTDLCMWTVQGTKMMVK